MAPVGFSAGLACLGMSGSGKARRTATFPGGPRKSARAAIASQLACALSPGAIKGLPSFTETGGVAEVARAYRDKAVLSKLATTYDVDLNASVDPWRPAGEVSFRRLAVRLHDSYC